MPICDRFVRVCASVCGGLVVETRGDVRNMQPSAVWRPRTALAAYRALLRAQRDLFVNDGAALAAAHAETRSAFLAQANAKPGDVPALVEDAFEASQFIRQNVAQAQLNERGNYGMRPPFWLAAAAVLPPPSSHFPAWHSVQSSHHSRSTSTRVRRLHLCHARRISTVEIIKAHTTADRHMGHADASSCQVGHVSTHRSRAPPFSTPPRTTCRADQLS